MTGRSAWIAGIRGQEKAAAALRFADWLVSDEAQRLIQAFGVDRYGAPLFFPNADQWRAKRP